MGYNHGLKKRKGLKTFFNNFSSIIVSKYLSPKPILSSTETTLKSTETFYMKNIFNIF